MIKKLRKYCCERLMDTKGVYDFDKKTQSLLYRCLCCGSFEETKNTETDRGNERNRGNIGVTEICKKP